MSVNKVEVLVSGHPWNAEKVFVTGTGRLREWFSCLDISVWLQLKSVLKYNRMRL